MATAASVAPATTSVRSVARLMPPRPGSSARRVAREREAVAASVTARGRLPDLWDVVAAEPRWLRVESGIGGRDLARLAPDQPYPLHGGEVGEHGEGPEGGDEQRRDHQPGDGDHDPLRSGEDPTIADEAEGLSPGSHVGDEQRAPQGDDDEHGRELTSAARDEVVEECRVGDDLRVTISGRVEEGAVTVDSVGDPGDGSVQDVEEPSEDEDDAAGDEPAQADQGGGHDGDGEPDEGEGIGSDPAQVDRGHHSARTTAHP